MMRMSHPTGNPALRLRRTVHLLVAGAALLAGLAGSLAPAADWPSYRGPSHDQISTETLGATTPKVVWRKPVGEAFGAFAVVGDRCYLMVERDRQESCIALNAANGKEVWEVRLGKTIFERNGGNGPRTTPAVSDGVVYAFGTWFNLVAVNAADGKVLWQHDLASEFGGQVRTGGIREWGNAMSPIVEGNLVIVAGGGPGSAFMAFDKKTGKVAWKGGDEKVTHATASPATIHGVRQIIFFAQSGLVSVEAGTGKELWRYAFPFSVSTAASPVIAGDVVYCSAGYNVGAGAVKITKDGDAFKATQIWRTPNKNINHWSTPVHKDGHLYGNYCFKEFFTGPLRCIELATGKELWAKPGFGQGEVMLIDGKLVALTEDGQLVVIDPSPDGYKEISRTPVLPKKCWNMLAFANGRMYARSDKEAVCLDMSGK